MMLPWVLRCVVWVWVCHALPHTKERNMNQAQECVLYGSQGTTPSVMQFKRRISVGIMAQSATATAQLVLQSTITSKTCQLFFMLGSIVPICEHESWTQQNLNEGDATELWMEMDEREGDASTTTWNLKVVARQGKHRTHMLLTDTSLEPPLNLWFNSSQGIQYYFNCITGCLFEKSVEMPPGHHTFYLRHDPGFVQMTLDAGLMKTYPIGDVSNPFPVSETGPPGNMDDVKFDTKALSINVTATQLGSPGNLKKIQVVWSKQLGDIGVLVDGVPLGDLIQYEPLKKVRQVKVEVADGGGLVTSCDPHFQTVACSSDEVTEAETTTTTESSSTETPSAAPIVMHPSQPHSSNWLPAVFTFVVLNFIVTIVAVCLAVVLYRRSSSETHNLPQGNSESSAIFSRKSSTRSSTRSTQRGSQRRKNKTDSTKESHDSENKREETRANSETVTTPLTTPDFPKTSKNVSTDEFVDLELM